MSSDSSDSEEYFEVEETDQMLEFDEDDEWSVAIDRTSGEVASSMTVKDTTISVVKADIAKETVDVIVNSTSTNLDLKSGRASRSLLKAAGNSLQAECSQKYPDGIAVGDIAVTGSGNLNCQYVYHGCLLKWDKDNAEKVHTDFITKCLEKADQDKMSSIAMPGLTTGFLSFPKDVAARNACKCVKEFLQKHQNTCLKDIRFVLHSTDRSTLKAFRSSVKKWKHGIDQAVPACTLGKFSVGSISVSVVVDKLEEQHVDVIINSTNTKLQLHKGSLSISLSKAAGPTLQQECTDSYPNGISNGDIAVTSGGNLNCQHVYHSCFTAYSHRNPTASIKILKDSVTKCLKMMNDDGLTSIALPALGTKFRKYPSRVSAKAIITAIEEYYNNNTTTSVTDIRIVIFGSDKNTIGKAFEKEMGRLTGARTKTSGITPTAEVVEEQRGTKQFCVKKYMEEIRPPSYWTHFSTEKTVKQWKLEITEKSLELVQTVDVDDQTVQDVSDLVQSTWKTQKVGHGRDAAGLADLGFSKLKVLKVQRIENIDLYEKYANARSQLFHKAGNIGMFEHITDIAGSKGEIESAKHAGEMLQRDMYDEVNEFYLFHGTKINTLSAIEKQGLDFRMAGEKAMFGQGMYLAESSTKADQYTDTKNKRSKESKHMFLSRVSMGKICLLSTAQNTLKRPPCFVSGCCSDSCSHGDHERCDSVVGDGQWIFREFVIYSQYQAYPEYIITYQRE